MRNRMQKNRRKNRQKNRQKRKWAILAAALAVSMLFSGCGEKKETVPDVVFANEGQTYQEKGSGESAAQTGTFDKEENVQVEADASGRVKKITVETRLRTGGGEQIEDYSVLHDIKNTEGDEEFRTAGGGTLFWEDSGEDIHYEGTSTEPLPVEMQISYELNGKKVAPKDLAGQSGKLKMRFDYVNRAKKTVSIKEKDIEVCVPFTVLSMVVLPENVFSEVEIENGKLLSMGDNRIAVGCVFPGLAESLKLSEMEDFEDIEIPDYVEITAQVTDFELDFTATVITPGLLEDFDPDDLKDIEEMIDDMDELRDASKELVDGTKELSDGVGEFGDYLQEYVDAMDELKSGTHELVDGVDQLAIYASKLTDGAKGLQQGLGALQQGLSGTDAAGTGTVSQGDAGSGAAADSGAAAADSAGAGGDTTGSSAAADGVDVEQLQALLVDMSVRLENLESSVSGGDAGAQADVAVLKQEMAMLQAYAGTLTETMTAAAKAQGELGKIVGQLAEGSKQLTQGLQAFNEGIHKLYEGTEALDDGTGKIQDAGKELRDGYDELIDGVGEFRDGVKKFDEEGIQKLADLAGEDLQNLVDRVRALKEADGSYINFGGIAPGKTGSVRFIIETEEIKK